MYIRFGFFQHYQKLSIQVESMCATSLLLLADDLVTVRRGGRLMEVTEGAAVAIKYAVDPQDLPSRNPAMY